MEVLYNYGISQEDVLSECRALEIAPGDALLCIASAGEIPLNMAALYNVSILAIDHSVNQLRLCRIKLAAATCLEPIRAASFLGYMTMAESSRYSIYSCDIRPLLPPADAAFWDLNPGAISAGVINSARFEQYIRKVSSIGRTILGEKNLKRLFECHSVEEQRQVFDRRITGPIVKGIFKLAFHPWIYKNRGIDPAGLTHSGARNIADFFYGRFRNFCCSTPARENYYLQYTFFNKVLFPEALPEYLQPAHRDAFLENSRHLEFRLAEFGDVLEQSAIGAFNKIHLSNVGDWMSKESMAGLFGLIRDKTLPGARSVMRYIHLNHEIPSSLPELVTDTALGLDIASHDRYPFYSIVPIIHKASIL